MRIFSLSIIWLALIGLLWATSVPASPVRVEHIEVELISEVQSVRPGEPFRVALRLQPDEHWHTYWRNPGDTGLPTQIDWRLPEGTKAGEIQWPYPERIPVKHLVNYGYGEKVYLLTEIRPPQDWSTRTFPLTASASWLVCNENCIPGEAELHLELPVAESAPQPDARWQATFRETRSRLPIDRNDWQASFAVHGERISLRVQAGSTLLSTAEKVTFFPISADIFDNAAAQNLDRTDSELILTQARSLFFEQAPAVLNGVLVVRTADGERAYAIGARHDPAMPPVVPAEPASTTAFPLLYILALAALGGLLLNLMPCVFPVLSLKAIGLAESSAVSPRARRLHGLAYTAGVVLSFAAVAGLMLLLQAGGASIGWGFQLQSPWFVALLAYLLFAMGLSLSGVADVGVGWAGIGDALTRKPGYAGSFFTGVLATIVASPCTAPFMATAIGFAITQTAAVALLVFTTLGLGMALPFLIFAWLPGMTRLLPKPGPWMESFKQAMAFPLYLSAVWLLWVLGRQTGPDAMAVVLGGMVLLGFALWLWGRRQRGAGRRVWRSGLALAAALTALAVLWMPPLTRSPEAASFETVAKPWEPYSAARLRELRAAGKPVFMNITADWCITCLVNEQIALNADAVRQKLIVDEIVYLKGDWTHRNPEITEILARFGRNGVPLYVFYPPGIDSEPVVLPQVLTSSLVLQALDHS